VTYILLSGDHPLLTDRVQAVSHVREHCLFRDQNQAARGYVCRRVSQILEPYREANPLVHCNISNRNVLKNYIYSATFTVGT
jgi:hypothetical protein